MHGWFHMKIAGVNRNLEHVHAERPLRVPLVAIGYRIIGRTILIGEKRGNKLLIGGEDFML
jgi:hypothetical protein